MLIRTPTSWSPILVAALAMVALAALDLIGAVAAKEAVIHRSPLAAAVGCAAFLLLFWVYASSLQVAELAPVTFGWIVILQVGVLLVDHYRYGNRLPVGSWVAVVVMVAAQAYLLVGPGGTTGTTEPAATGSISASVSVPQSADGPAQTDGPPQTDWPPQKSTVLNVPT